MRKALRRSGARTKILFRGVQEKLTRWLPVGKVAVVLNPAPESGGQQFPGCAVAGEGIWEVECKDISTYRLTHILRLNVMRPDPATRATLVTPPPTDLDFSSLSSSHDSDLPSSLSDVQSIDGASDVLSEADFASDPELPTHRRALPPAGSASDAEADAENGSGIDAGAGVSDLEQATEALSWTNDDETPRRAPRRTAAYRTRAAMWECGRSGSSRSRSPVRRKLPRRPLGRMRKKPTSNDSGGRESFYDYLFK